MTYTIGTGKNLGKFKDCGQLLIYGILIDTGMYRLQTVTLLHRREKKLKPLLEYYEFAISITSYILIFLLVFFN